MLDTNSCCHRRAGCAQQSAAAVPAAVAAAVAVSLCGCGDCRRELLGPLPQVMGGGTGCHLLPSSSAALPAGCTGPRLWKLCPVLWRCPAVGLQLRVVLAALVAGAPAHWNGGDSGDGDGGDGGGGHCSYHCKQRVAFQGMQGHCPAGRKAGPASLEAAEWRWSLPVLARTLGEGQVHLGWAAASCCRCCGRWGGAS